MRSGPSPAVTAARCGALSVVRTSRWGAVSATGNGVEATVETHLIVVYDRSAMRDVMWAPLAGPGLEHLHLAADWCTRVLIATEEDRLYSFSYHLTWDPRWLVRTVDARLLGGGRQPLPLRADGDSASRLDNRPSCRWSTSWCRR